MASDRTFPVKTSRTWTADTKSCLIWEKARCRAQICIHTHNQKSTGASAFKIEWQWNLNSTVSEGSRTEETAHRHAGETWATGDTGLLTCRDGHRLQRGDPPCHMRRLRAPVRAACLPEGKSQCEFASSPSSIKHGTGVNGEKGRGSSCEVTHGYKDHFRSKILVENPID